MGRLENPTLYLVILSHVETFKLGYPIPNTTIDIRVLPPKVKRCCSSKTIWGVGDNTDS